MKKKTTRGLLVADRGVYPILKTTASQCGWSVKTLPLSIKDTLQDSTIARMYGKGRSILLTYDKLAYTHNTKNGFIGYIEYDSIPTKVEFDDFILYFKEVISSFKRKDIDGYRLIIHKDSYEKILLE